MSFSDAEQLVRSCGAGRFLQVGARADALASELLQRGATVSRWDGSDTSGVADCVVAEAQWLAAQPSLEQGFGALRKLARRWLVVRFGDAGDELRQGAAGLRASWEDAACAAGWRRAPQAVSVLRYRTEKGEPRVPLLLEFERIPDAALEALLPDGDRPMDMSRASGSRSDAHMVRYALAAELVRPGDTVLDCACGPGYGGAILAAQSAGARFIGVDIDPGTAAYAAANFGEQYGNEYHAASDLAGIDDDTVDLVVSFQAIEHRADFHAFLAEVRRVLKPDGRIIASVPHLWVDGTGSGPHPNAVQAFDYARFSAAMGAHFLLEERWSQTAPGGFKLLQAPRRLDKLPLDAPDQDTEWMILVGSVDPLSKRSTRPYCNGAFSGAEGDPASWVADFGEHYDNPWLYRAMVQQGDRIRDRAVLTDLAARALGQLPMQSADFGAALTVLGYALLEQPGSEHVDDVLDLVREYATVDSANPHLKRWQISSVYVAGKLALMRGNRALARAFFEAVVQADFLEFSPLLATKPIAAAFQLGAMALGDDDLELAARHFAAGVAACRKALHADDRNAIGNPAAPLPFGFMELGEVADMGAHCATAIRLLPMYRRSPGLFWQKVDTRRFGVVTWARAVERDNLVLRQMLAR